MGSSSKRLNLETPGSLWCIMPYRIISVLPPKTYSAPVIWFFPERDPVTTHDSALSFILFGFLPERCNAMKCYVILIQNIPIFQKFPIFQKLSFQKLLSKHLWQIWNYLTGLMSKFLKIRRINLEFNSNWTGLKPTEFELNRTYFRQNWTELVNFNLFRTEFKYLNYLF